MDESQKFSALNKIQKEFFEFEKKLETNSSVLHEPRWLKITKLSGKNNFEYKEGHTEKGFCKGIEVGKRVYLYDMGIRARWFITSVVQSIDNNTFKTLNSIYSYEWDFGK